MFYITYNKYLKIKCSNFKKYKILRFKIQIFLTLLSLISNLINIYVSCKFDLALLITPIFFENSKFFIIFSRIVRNST